MRSQARNNEAATFAADQLEAARLNALNALDVLDTPPEPEFDRIARLIKNIFGVSIAIVSMIDAHRQWYKACVGMSVGEVPREHTFCTLTIRESVPVVSNDTTKDPRFAGNPYVTGAPHVRFYAGIPLRTGAGHAIGTLCAIHTEPMQFGDRELAILNDLAEIVMAEIELRQLASTDLLTGTMSRRVFEKEGADAVALSLRHKSHLSCIAIDLDHFKGINDTYGHAAGDKVLAAAAGTLRENLRQSDRLARIGGEEFAILLPHTDRAGALEVAEKLRDRVAATIVPVGAVKIGITASFGVAALDIATKDIHLLLAHADTALYQAKSGGRNKCVAWRSTEPLASVRRRVLKAGQVIFNGRQSVIDCTVRSLSDEDAGLDVSNTLGIPALFRLSIRADGFETECRVVSRSERRLEVEFI